MRLMDEVAVVKAMAAFAMFFVWRGRSGSGSGRLAGYLILVEANRRNASQVDYGGKDRGGLTNKSRLIER
jgi:hypothetical protein